MRFKYNIDPKVNSVGHKLFYLNRIKYKRTENGGIYKLRLKYCFMVILLEFKS